MAGRQYPNIYRTICRRIQSTKSAFFVQRGGLSVPVNKQQVQRGVRGLLGRSASTSGLHPRNLASRICPCNKLSIYSFFKSLYFYSLFFIPMLLPTYCSALFTSRSAAGSTAALFPILLLCLVVSTFHSCKPLFSF